MPEPVPMPVYDQKTNVKAMYDEERKKIKYQTCFP